MPVNMIEFAKKVNEVAKKSPSKYRFGPYKVYIYWVWALGFKGQMSLDRFKELLREAHRAGLVILSRADLVSVMNQEWLRKSEIEMIPGSDTAVANFVLIH